jgi:tRNA A37 N6-isopentenylltransferase MiaA
LELTLSPPNVREVKTVPAPRFNIGLLWDKYTPRVESKITSHLISLNDVYRERIAAVVIDEKAAQDVQRVATALRIPVVVGGNNASVWSVYIVNEQPEIPENAETAYYVNIGQEKHKIVLTPDDPRYPNVFNKNDERYVPPAYQLNLNKTPPRHVGWDPQRFWRFGI